MARKDHKIKLVPKDLESVAAEAGAGKNPAGHTYATTRNKKNGEKLEIRKYNKVLRKHIIYKETKAK